ncbi:PAS domain-containing sensor histidine kinase [Streptomyces hiroshimensis]|uniref:PAS domain-containing sensor histidine kinase n=1 Tax=Streptomyces hiroshimensis TaxID=66424 RepID=UPI001E552DE0|nr:PAS domain-containing sensor histidine kinase [Streptomyces hiroshimensis]
MSEDAGVSDEAGGGVGEDDGRWRTLLDALLEALPAGAVVQGPDDRVLAANRRFTRMFGAEVRAGGMPVFGAESRAGGIPGGRHVHRTAEIPLADGRTLRRVIEPLRHGGAYLGALWTYDDITEHKRRERDLERDNVALTELARQRNAFTAAASHELRTPLTSIISFCELLTDPAFGALTHEQASFLEAVRRNADRMQRVISDLLLTTRMRATAGLELEFGAVEVDRMLLDAVLDRMGAAQEAGLFTVLECAPGPLLRGDRHRLQNVLANLLENAAKYTPAGGRISVTAAPHGEFWEIEVADTGIGVPEEFREEIFNGFVRAPNARTGGYPGTGLGLAISRAIVQLHGGAITVGGAEGGGAAFVIRLPVAGPPPAGETA